MQKGETPTDGREGNGLALNKAKCLKATKTRRLSGLIHTIITTEAADTGFWPGDPIHSNCST